MIIAYKMWTPQYYSCNCVKLYGAFMPLTYRSKSYLMTLLKSQHFPQCSMHFERLFMKKSWSIQSCNSFCQKKVADNKCDWNHAPLTLVNLSLASTHTLSTFNIHMSIILLYVMPLSNNYNAAQSTCFRNYAMQVKLKWKLGVS